MRSIVGRGKKGIKYHIAVNGCGVPVACAATAANMNDTLLFERLFRTAFVVMARIRTAFADKAYDAKGNRDLCRKSCVEPRIGKRGQPHGSSLGKQRWPVERTNAWLLENKRLGLRYDRLGFVVESLLQAACGHRQLVGLRSRWRMLRAACSWLRRSGDAGDLGPNLKGLGPCGSILGGRHLAAAEVEEVVDPVMGGQEALRLAG